MRARNLALWTVVAVIAAGTAHAGPELSEPEAVKAGDASINVDVGHAAPFVCDWDGDGQRDLLVGQMGQMGQGRLRIYKNTGTNKAPAFSDHEIFKVGESEGTVPTG